MRTSGSIGSHPEAESADGDGADPGRFRSAPAGLLVGAGGFLLAVYWPLLTAPAGYLPSSEFHDFFSLFYPAAEVARGMVRDGDWPLWNPYAFCGTPLLASVQLGLLYPPNWLHLLIPPPRAFNLLLVGHMLFAAAGTWLYCRGRSRSIAAATLACIVTGTSGKAILHLYAGHPQIVYSAAWLPVIFWLVDRCLRRPDAGRCCALSIGLALHFLAGWPMFSLLLAYLIPIYVLVCFRHRSAAGNWTLLRASTLFGAIALLGLGLVAAQLLPTLEYMGQSHRGGGVTYGWATSGSFPPVNLLTFIVPGFFGDHVTFPYWGEISVWESSAFCGVVPLLLALVGLSVRPDRVSMFLAGAGLAVLALAMGKYSPLYEFCYWYVPGVDLFRGVSKLSVFVVLAVAVLAGRGLDLVFDGDGRSRSWMKLLWAVTLALGLAGALFALVETQVAAPAPQWWQSLFEWVRRPDVDTLLQIPPAERDALQSRSYNFMLGRLLVSSLVLAAAGTVFLNARWLRRAGKFLTIALLCGELYWAVTPYLQVSDTAPYREPARRVRESIDDDDVWRFCAVTTDETLTNQFAGEKLQGIGGVQASLLTRYTRVFRALSVSDPQLLTYLSLPIVHEQLFDLLNVKYYSATTQAPRIGDCSSDRLLVEGVFELDRTTYDLYENVDVLPRAFVVHQVQEVDYEEAGQILFPRLLREGPESASFVEGRLPFELEEVSPAEQVAESCTITSSGPDRMTLDVDLKGNGLVLIVENYYPGWTAEVDGVNVAMLPANLVMRAIPVAAGRHTITIRYAPSSLRIGMLVSILAWCLAGLIWLWSARQPADRTLLSPMISHGPAILREDGPEADLRRSRACWLPGRLIGLTFFSTLVGLIFLLGGWICSLLLDVRLPGESNAWSPVLPAGIVIGTVVLLCSGGWLYRRSRRRLLLGCAAVALLLPTTLLLLEGVARVLVPAWPVLGLHGVEPDVALKSWASGTSPAGGVGINDWGQRDMPRSIDAPQGTRRIAFVGDSFLEESTSIPVSVRTQQRMARDDLEVLNLGVSASSPDEYYFRIRNIALRLDVDHCMMFVFAGNDFVESVRSLESFAGIAAVYPRDSLLSSLGMLGVNHVLTNRRRPVLQVWLTAGDLRKQEQLRFLAISLSSDEAIRQLLLSTAALPAEQTERLRMRLDDPGMHEFFEMLRSPDAGRFRSYYLAQGLWSAAQGGAQWDENPVASTWFWVQQAASLCRDRGAEFTLVIIPEAFAVDPRMAEQWSPLTDMKHLTHPCRVAARQLRERATAAGVRVIDLHEAFEGVPGTYLNLDGHWSEKGVELASGILQQRLAAEDD